MAEKRSFFSWIRIALTSLTGATMTNEKDSIPEIFNRDHVGQKPKNVQYRQKGKGTLFSKAPVEKVDPIAEDGKADPSKK